MAWGSMSFGEGVDVGAAGGARGDSGRDRPGGAGSLSRGSLTIRVRDGLGPLFSDEQFAVCLRRRGPSAASRPRLERLADP